VRVSMKYIIIHIREYDYNTKIFET
jgi:hypothetical protein